ncbi:COG3014 family protein [Geminisphaera colitermitum]|uniref:COG3014 family protein n=1 Tax=Geminisphaera colitermitum TaxID=1148786 RepID=UPI000158C968|nr:hypothetical protein [Geminisphaera colitermitum]
MKRLKNPLPQYFLVAAIAACALILSGCQTHSQKSAPLDTVFRAGNLTEAVKEADKMAEKNADSPKDSIIWHLEQGAVLRAAASSPSSVANAAAFKPKKGDEAPSSGPLTSEDFLKKSNAAFDLAEARINEWEEQAKVKVGSEIGASFTNLANLPYRGRAYDKIMLNTYKALNHMQLGDLEAARVELNRSLQRQRDAVDENAKRIEENEAEIGKARSGADTKGTGFDASKTISDFTNQADTPKNLNMAALDAAAAANPYANYVNPFSVLIDGIFFSACALDDDDMEHARKSFERVSQMVPANPFARQDLSDITAGAPATGLTYVIYESGSAPFREEYKLVLPISLLAKSSVPNVVVAFPYLKFYDMKPPLIRIGAGGGEIQPALVCNMDSVIARDFKNEWPTILTKTIISAAVKAILDAATQEAVKGQGTLQLLAKFGTLAAQTAVTIADTRQWRSLPKEFYYARIPTPADRTLLINAGDGNPHQVELVEGNVNVVYVKSIAPGVTPLISQFTLRGRGAMPGYVPSPSAPVEQATAQSAVISATATPSITAVQPAPAATPQPAFLSLDEFRVAIEKIKTPAEIENLLGKLGSLPAVDRDMAGNLLYEKTSQLAAAASSQPAVGSSQEMFRLALSKAKTPREVVAALNALPLKQRTPEVVKLFAEKMEQLMADTQSSGSR